MAFDASGCVAHEEHFYPGFGRESGLFGEAGEHAYSGFTEDVFFTRRCKDHQWDI
jgi:hypothetical protein